MNNDVLKTPKIEGPDGALPALGFGTWQLKAEVAKRAVQTALETGYRHIDTARAYGNEKEVGQGIAESGVSRENVFLTTKIFNDSLDENGRIINPPWAPDWD